MPRSPDRVAVTVFMSSLRCGSALEALSLAREASRAESWTYETQRAVTDEIMKLFAERSRARRAGRAVSA
jgi:hypothetical protein